MEREPYSERQFPLIDADAQPDFVIGGHLPIVEYQDRDITIGELEAAKRINILETVALYSQGICHDLNIPQPYLITPAGSTAARRCLPSSNLDADFVIDPDHPLALSQQLRRQYSTQLSLLIEKVINPPFDVSILLVAKKREADDE